MPGWSDVDDHGVPRLREEWRAAPDHPPIEVVGTIDVPRDWLGIEQTPAE